jgi:hypothetical protein
MKNGQAFCSRWRFSPGWSAVLARFALSVVIYFPFTLESSAWYAGYGYFAPAIFVATVLYAFGHSLGGQPMFGRTSLED